MAEAIYSEQTWRSCKLDYFSGTWKSLKELSERYSINYNTLAHTIKTKGWKEEMEQRMAKISDKVEESVELQAKKYLKEKFIRLKRYEKIINSSMEHLGAKDSEGNPLLDPEAIDSYTKSEARLHDMAKSCLGIRESSSVDVTSGGKSLGDSFADAMEKLRGAKLPELTDREIIEAREARIIEG